MNKKTKVSLLFLILMTFAWLFFRPYRISGDCMEPTIKDGGLYFSNQLAPYLRGYKINDIILFKHEDRIWFSRIVALGNDMIHIREKEIIMNGVTVKDTKISRNWNNWNHGSYAVSGLFKVPTGHVFVLSDNLNSQHDDSRVFGPIHKSSIVGLLW